MSNHTTHWTETASDLDWLNYQLGWDAATIAHRQGLDIGTDWHGQPWTDGYNDGWVEAELADGHV